MRSLNKLTILAAVVGTVGMVATTADARPWHRHHHHHHHRGGGWVGPAIIGGLALGALATAPRYYGAYGACERQVVGYTPSGRPVVRTVCY